MTAIRHGCVLALGCALACAQPKDELLEAAREAAKSYTADLPNFLVQQVTTRYRRIPQAPPPAGWR